MMRYGDEAWKALPMAQRPSFYALAKDDLTEPDGPCGHLVGRDPRQIPREVLSRYYPAEAGGAGNGRVVRAKCLDCSCGQESEVRKCTALACALWPYRMGTNPFTNRKGGSLPLRRVNRASSEESELPAIGVPETH